MTSPVAVVANEVISVEELVSFLSSLAVRIAVAKVVDRGTVEIDREDVVAHNLQPFITLLLCRGCGSVLKPFPDGFTQGALPRILRRVRELLLVNCRD